MTDDASGPGEQEHGAPPTSDLAEETRRVVGALQDWMQRSVPESHGGPDCQWCPICQLAGVLRGERPEVTEKLAEAGAAIAGALKALVEAAGAHTPDPAQQSTPVAERPRPRPRVERIDLDEQD